MRKIVTKKLITIIIALPFISGIFAPAVFASSSNGTIDTTYKHAWGENIGWINFGTTEGNVQITDSAMTGYAWSENLGWIPLNCLNDNSCSTINYQISNNGNGTLSGYSWSENTGWISYAPTNGGVTIGSGGEFAGYAWGENIGWIVFNCSTTNSCATANYKVKTDWRPQRIRPACNNGLDDDGDNATDYPNDSACDSLDDTNESPSATAGGGFTSTSTTSTTAPKTAAPTKEFVILINNNTQKTYDRSVKLFLKGNANTKTAWISESPDFPEGLQVPYNAPSVQVTFILSEDEGSKTVYAKFCDENWDCSSVVSDNIIFNRTKPIIKLSPAQVKPVVEKPETTTTEEPGVEPGAEPTVEPGAEPTTEPTTEPGAEPTTEPSAEPTAEPGTEPTTEPSAEPTVEPGAEPTTEPAIEPISEPSEPIIPTEAPLAMSGEWELLPQQSINEFTMAPLPENLIGFVEKFPDLQDTFNSIGINRLTDIENLRKISFTLPGLSESIGLPKNIPVNLLSEENKRLLPSEVVFVKTGGGFVDINSVMNVTNKGETRQKIASIAGKPLELVIKVDKPVKNVTGYITYKSRTISSKSSRRLMASLLSANLSSDKPQENVEERLVLQKFEYADTDGDGIYTANITTPLVDGEYEIITVMDYKNPELGTKEIKLITIIDPEGYIYEKAGNKEIRIPGAITSLYWLNPDTDQYELWPAEKFQQENPQTTDVRGTYSFLAPEGFYYIKVEAPGYTIHEGKPFQLKKDIGVHTNIELRGQYWWLEIIDWKTILLIIVAILLLYNFYRDKLREKFTKN